MKINEGAIKWGGEGAAVLVLEGGNFKVREFGKVVERVVFEGKEKLLRNEVIG